MANKKPQKNDRAAQARKAAQAQMKAQERRTAAIIGVSAIAVVLLFAGIVYFIVRSADIPTLDSDDVVAPAAADTSGGIPVGTGGVAGADVPEDAARLDIYQDFMCPICNQFEQINAEDLNTLREAGEVAIYYHPISILDRYSSGTEYSTRSANAAATIADQAPEYFLAFQAAMYENQPAENTEGLTDAQISDIAVSVGVPQEVADTFVDGTFTKWVIAATDQSNQDGISGTPMLRMADAGDSFSEGKVLDQTTDVSYFEEGALLAYGQSVGAGELEVTSATSPSPGASE
ncbi:thioredoxin domain-containing protein [Demequina sp. NBRC 110057]|uniref:DsbA family protein n=1 Tax=Demequina sp. NBRC 110057 TaxID=1570346 RepID=UPI000A05218C|nr:thioredoxin domain-containing protein [Demequina sp. NBRC 110057]